MIKQSFSPHLSSIPFPYLSSLDLSTPLSVHVPALQCPTPSHHHRYLPPFQASLEEQRPSKQYCLHISSSHIRTGFPSSDLNLNLHLHLHQARLNHRRSRLISTQPLCQDRPCGREVIAVGEDVADPDDIRGRGTSRSEG